MVHKKGLLLIKKQAILKLHKAALRQAQDKKLRKIIRDIEREKTLLLAEHEPLVGSISYRENKKLDKAIEIIWEYLKN